MPNITLGRQSQIRQLIVANCVTSLQARLINCREGRGEEERVDNVYVAGVLKAAIWVAKLHRASRNWTFSMVFLQTCLTVLQLLCCFAYDNINLNFEKLIWKRTDWITRIEQMVNTCIVVIPRSRPIKIRPSISLAMRGSSTCGAQKQLLATTTSSIYLFKIDFYRTLCICSGLVVHKSVYIHIKRSLTGVKGTLWNAECFSKENTYKSYLCALGWDLEWGHGLSPTLFIPATIWVKGGSYEL